MSLPPLACDAHVHVFGPVAHFAYDADAPCTPADAPKEIVTKKPSGSRL